MSSEEGTRLRSCKIFDISVNPQSSNPQIMAEVNNAETESVGESNVTSQIAEIEDNYERKFNEVVELKNLMMAMMEKSSNTRTTTSGKSSSKQPLQGSDTYITN